MDDPEFANLCGKKQVKIVQEMLSDKDSDEQKKLIFDMAHHQMKRGCYQILGEPSSTIQCSNCFKQISLGTECFGIKEFSKEFRAELAEYHWKPRVLCDNCGVNATVDEDYKIGVKITGILERRRTRPGDPCSAPYIFYVDPKDDGVEEIISEVGQKDRLF